MAESCVEVIRSVSKKCPWRNYPIGTDHNVTSQCKSIRWQFTKAVSHVTPNDRMYHNIALKCRTVRHPSVRYRNELKCRYREQSGTGTRGSSPVPECSGTGLRCQIPECRCWRHWSRCRCPSMMVSLYLSKRVAALGTFCWWWCRLHKNIFVVINGGL